ncbi:hypothetical protein LCGC14_1889680 [marine sediment metagenome]|uniref:Uncharacterized protein n=1 Tax=marine sediment metagenome TaxID=412755 RepID=A0A0F9FZT1_9ZZZZ
MLKCIKCDMESEHSICKRCADELLDNMNPKDLVAHALVGMDVMKGKKDLNERLKFYKSQLRAMK